MAYIGRVTGTFLHDPARPGHLSDPFLGFKHSVLKINALEHVARPPTRPQPLRLPMDPPSPLAGGQGKPVVRNN